MKTMARIVLYLMILCFCGCSSKKNEVIIAVNTGNRVGYFTDSKGNIIIDKQFDGVSSFSNGLAKVKQNGKWGFVNTKGEIVIPCVYDDGDVYSFSEGLARIKQNGKWGFINSKGKVVIPCVYDAAISFSEGLAAVVQNDKCGFINTKGELVISCVYDYMGFLSGFSEGLLWLNKMASGDL